MKARPTPNSLKVTESLPSLSTTGIGILAAGQELGGLARYGRQVRLGQRAHQAVALQSAQRAGQLRIAAGEAVGEARSCRTCRCGTLILVAELTEVAQVDAVAGSSASVPMPGIGSVPRPAAAVSGSAFSVRIAVEKLPDVDERHRD